jgi:mannitol operon repressor
VLTAVAMLDDLLGRVLQSFLIDNEGTKALMEGPFAPIGTLAAKAAAAYAMGLISADEKREIDTLRKIRNVFAHEVHVSFSSEKVAKLCVKLMFCAEATGNIAVDSSRGQFSTSSAFMILSLTNRPHYVRERRLTYQKWKY